LEFAVMWRGSASAFEDDARGLANTLMAMRFLWVGAGVCVLGGVASWWQAFPISPWQRALLIGAQAVLGLLCLVGTRLVHRLPARRLVLGAGWASVAAASMAALSLGHGAFSLDLAFFPLVVCIVAVLAGTGQAFVLMLGCAVIVMAMAWAKARGWLAGSSALAAAPLSHPLVTHGLLLLAGFTVGAIMLRLSNTSFTKAREREAALRRSESMLSTVFATSPDCLSLSEFASGRNLMVNQAFVDLFGYARDELIGRTVNQVSVWDSLEDRARMLAALREHGQVAGLRVRMRKRSGEPVNMLLSAALCRLDGVEHLVINSRDVTADDRLREEQAAVLERARDAAEAASRAKGAFLANTSHEIRTPLNGLLGLARLALRDELPEAQRKAYVSHILDTAQGLSDTLSDVLDLSKIEAGKLDLEAAPFRLRAALDALCHVHMPLAQAKGLSLSLQVDPALPAVVRGDASRVRQVVGNFISNAIKFTERGGVRIHAAVHGRDGVRFAVIDTGIGIDAAAQGRLFQPFSQADESTTRLYGGTGLGLSICRQLARLMGGSVGVRSVAGEGSEFWAELPLPGVDASALAPAHDAEADELRALRGARVLVAEDNPVNMLITHALLEQWGVHVVQATDGHAVIDAVAQAERDGLTFDAVLMDVQMPRLSGHAAARALRERFGERAPPIIALTAAALVSERDEALNAGMLDFLTKPIQPERLRSVLARWVQRTHGY
jgi:PAS domain S-box-containing protein